jgi:hypothetical protein
MTDADGEGVEMELICSSGKVNAETGDRFRDWRGEWEIVGFSDKHSYSPAATPNVVVKPSELRHYARDDGTIDKGGASVAAAILSNRDGKPRDARGVLLRST